MAKKSPERKAAEKPMPDWRTWKRAPETPDQTTGNIESDEAQDWLEANDGEAPTKNNSATEEVGEDLNFRSLRKGEVVRRAEKGKLGSYVESWDQTEGPRKIWVRDIIVRKGRRGAYYAGEGDNRVEVEGIPPEGFRPETTTQVLFESSQDGKVVTAEFLEGDEKSLAGLIKSGEIDTGRKGDIRRLRVAIDRNSGKATADLGAGIVIPIEDRFPKGFVSGNYTDVTVWYDKNGTPAYGMCAMTVEDRSNTSTGTFKDLKPVQSALERQQQRSSGGSRGLGGAEMETRNRRGGRGREATDEGSPSKTLADLRRKAEKGLAGSGLVIEGEGEAAQVVKAKGQPRRREIAPTPPERPKPKSLDELLPTMVPALHGSAIQFRDAIVKLRLAQSRARENNVDDEKGIEVARTAVKNFHQRFPELLRKGGRSQKQDEVVDAIDLAAHKIAYNELSEDLYDAVTREVEEHQQAWAYGGPARSALKKLEKSFKEFFPGVENGSREVKQEVFNEMEEKILKNIDGSLEGYEHPKSLIALRAIEKKTREELKDLLWWYREVARSDPQLLPIARGRIRDRKETIFESVTGNTIASMEAAINADLTITKASENLNILKTQAREKLEHAYYWRFAGDEEAIKAGRKKIYRLVESEVERIFATRTEPASEDADEESDTGTASEPTTDAAPDIKVGQVETAADEALTGVSSEVSVAFNNFREKISRITIAKPDDLADALRTIRIRVFADLGPESLDKLEENPDLARASTLRNNIETLGREKVDLNEVKDALQMAKKAAIEIAQDYAMDVETSPVAVAERVKEPLYTKPPRTRGPNAQQGPAVQSEGAGATPTENAADAAAAEETKPTPQERPKLEYQPVYDKFYGKFLREWMKAMNVRIGADGKPELSDGIEYPAFATLRPKARLAFAENYAENATERILEKMGLEKVKGE